MKQEPDAKEELPWERREREAVGARIRGYCPSCGFDTLFYGSGGYVTCSWLPCKGPGDASDLLIHGKTGVTRPSNGKPQSAPDPLRDRRERQPEQDRKAFTHALTSYGVEPTPENYTRVIQRLDDLVDRRERVIAPQLDREDLKDLLCCVSQIFGGWRPWKEWSQWDEEIAQRVVGWQRKLEADPPVDRVIATGEQEQESMRATLQPQLRAGESDQRDDHRG